VPLNKQFPLFWLPGGPFCHVPFVLAATLVLIAATFATAADARIAPVLIVFRRVRSTFTFNAPSLQHGRRFELPNQQSAIFHTMQGAIFELRANLLTRDHCETVARNRGPIPARSRKTTP
jgi:hypothetical protein